MTNAACKHEQMACGRCGTVYECKVGSINLCQCMAVQLTEDQRQYIGSIFSGCLCANCLLALRTEYNVNQHQEQLDELLTSR